MSRKRHLRLKRSVLKNEDDGDSKLDDDIDNMEDCVDLWTKEETSILIAAIKKQLKDRDQQSYIRRIQLLDWNKIKIEGKGVKECKSRLTFVIKKIRHMRNLGEILDDVDLDRVDVVKPKSAYALFCEEMKNESLEPGTNFFKEASSRFRNLSKEKKAQLEEESKKQSIMYKQIHPKGTRRKPTVATPYSLFIEFQAKNGETDKDKVKKLFAKLDDKARMKWIQSAVALAANEDITDLDRFLNRDEISLYKGEPKPPMNAFNLFVKQSAAEGKSDFKTSTQGWKTLTQEQKNVYIEQARLLKAQYELDKAKYLFSLSEEERIEYLSRLNQVSKRKKETKPKAVSVAAPSDDEVDEQDEEQEEVQNNDFCSEQYIINFVAPPSTTDITIKAEDSFEIPCGNSTMTQVPATEATVISETNAAQLDKNPEITNIISITASDTTIEASIPQNTTNCNQLPSQQEIIEIGTSNGEEVPTLNTTEQLKKKLQKRRNREDIESIAKKIKKEVEEPKRIPEQLFIYFMKFIYTGKAKKAKKAYIRLEPEERKKLKKQHKHARKEYMSQLKVYCESLSKKEMSEFSERYQREEEADAEISDPDN